MSAPVGHRLPGQQSAHDRQALVHPLAAAARVDAADHHLMAVVAAGADAEHRPSGRDLGERRHLAGDGHRVAERQQVDGRVDGHRWSERSERGGLHEPVEALAAPEADVVADAHLVDAASRGPLQQCRRCAGTGTKHLVRWPKAHRDRGGGSGLGAGHSDSVGVSVSRPERSTVPGRCVGVAAGAHDLGAVTITCRCRWRRRTGGRPRRAGRSACDGLGGDGVRVEHDHVGHAALGERAPVAQAVEAGGHVGDEVDRLLQRQQAVLAHRLPRASPVA